MLGEKRQQRPGSKSATKPGRPVAIAPSKRQRHQVELGIAAGLTQATLAVALGLSRRTFARVFAAEIESGRARVILEMMMCLSKAARKGNGAAAKALLGFVQRSEPEEQAIAVDRWQGLEDRVHYGDAAVLPENKISRLDS
jgi:DNA-binding XRE family transcriptional regulator